MMITIHGLPADIRYQDVKQLIKEHCDIDDFILDSLSADEYGCKKMRVGLADDEEGSIVMTRLNGYQLGGKILRVVPYGKAAKKINQPPQNTNYGNQHDNFGNQPNRSYGQQNYQDPGPPIHDPWATNTKSWQSAPIVPVPDNQNYLYGNQGPTGQFGSQPRQFPRDVAAPVPPQPPVPGFEKNHYSKPIPPEPRPNIRNIDLMDNSARNATNQQFGNNTLYRGADTFSQNKPQPMPKDKFDSGPDFGSDRSRSNFRPTDSRPAVPPSPWANSFQPLNPAKEFEEKFEKPNFDKEFTNRGAFDTPRFETRDRRDDYRREEGRRVSPAAKRQLSPGRRVDPFGRPISPNRRYSPTARQTSPTGRFSPSRRISPRRFSPLGRKISPTRRMSPPGRKISPRRVSPGRRFSPTRRMSPPGRRMSPHGRKLSPPGRKMSPHGRKMSPPGRKMSPHGRKISPPARKISPFGRSTGRRISPKRESPANRRLSPTGARRFSPSGRIVHPPGVRVSPPGRRISPNRRERPISPYRRISPNRLSPRRKESPRRIDKPSDRYSPSRIFEDKHYSDSHRSNAAHKQVRPAYEPSGNQAPKHPKYSGTYHPSITENVQYPVRGAGESWPAQICVASDLYEKKPEDKYPREDKRRSRSPIRRERSPMRDRSPVRDRYKSSRSPRRSWAMEKRSPDDKEVPPPPAWPGASSDRRISDKEDRRPDWEPKKPVWDMNKDEPRRDTSRYEETRSRRDDDRFGREHRFDRPEPPSRRETDRNEGRSKFDKRASNDVHPDDFRLDDSPRYDYRKDGRNNREEDRRRETERYRGDKDKPSTHESRFDRLDRPEVAKSRQDLSAIRKKASTIISDDILKKNDISSDRVQVELEFTINLIVEELVSDRNATAEDLVMKFYQKFSSAGQQKILADVIASLPKQNKLADKRAAAEPSHRPAKIPKVDDMKHLETVQAKLRQLYEAKAALVTRGPILATVPDMQQVPPPQVHQTASYAVPSTSIEQIQKDFEANFVEYGHDLYLCKDNFEVITEYETTMLRDFIVSQIFEEASHSGWTPTFTLRGLKSMHRYEVYTEDDRSKEWLMKLDFSPIKVFDVLVYTKEELWYERAAVWLPGHSAVDLTPFEKLKLQNKNLEGIQIDKWKFVKEIKSSKGVRIYVDMPPAAARALEKYSMMLSYELQKVNVYLKAVAVDKDAFDSQLNELSSATVNDIKQAIKNAVIPMLHDEPQLIKIGLANKQVMPIPIARKIKQLLIDHIFRYQASHSRVRTDFKKYGICKANYFAVHPENDETQKWLLSLDLGQINNIELYIDGYDKNTKYLRFEIKYRDVTKKNYQQALELLTRNAVQVRNLNISKWKVVDYEVHLDKDCILTVDVDLDSAEKLLNLNMKLFYGKSHTKALIHHRYGNLKALIKKMKKEMKDSYDVKNMDLDSDHGNNAGSDDDVIMLN